MTELPAVFTLQSIKSRIETYTLLVPESAYGTLFLLYSPLNQGLKQEFLNTDKLRQVVFTLQSIKSRIETPSDDQ